MSMDVLLKADKSKFVSPPFNFEKFLNDALNIKKKMKQFTRNFSTLECLMEAEIETGMAKQIMEAIDTSDLQSLMPNSELDHRMEVNNLVSQKFLNEEHSRRRNETYNLNYLRSLKYNKIDSTVFARRSVYYDERKQAIEEKENSTLNTYKNLLIDVSICNGYRLGIDEQEILPGKILEVTDRVVLTGMHNLYDLMQSIVSTGKCSLTDDNNSLTTFKDFRENIFITSMFFIHDTFYVEDLFRDQKSEIRKWAASKKSFGPFEVKIMKNVLLAHLTARLRQPYIFVHMGCCEHVIIFNDLSLKDELYEGVQFPRKLIDNHLSLNRTCDACKSVGVQYAIYDHNDLFPNSPAFLCGECYSQFCFTVDKQKICDFTALRYTQNF